METNLLLKLSWKSDVLNGQHIVDVEELCLDMLTGFEWDLDVIVSMWGCVIRGLFTMMPFNPASTLGVGHVALTNVGKTIINLFPFQILFGQRAIHTWQSQQGWCSSCQSS